MFNGLLKKRSEEKCNNLMIWVGEKVMDAYSTCHITNEEEKKRDILHEMSSIKMKMKLVRQGSVLVTLSKNQREVGYDRKWDIANLYDLSRIQLKTITEEPKGNSAGNESKVNRIETKHPHRGRQPKYETCRICGRERSKKCPAIGNFERVFEFSANNYGSNNYKSKRGEPSRFRGILV